MAYGLGLVTESMIRALDTAIQSLDRQISASKEPRVNEPFKEAWRAYTVRWQIQRDAWLQHESVLRKALGSEKVYDQFKVALQKWQADYQRRIKGAAATPPKVRPPEPSRPLFGNLFAGTGTALLIAGAIIGGIILFQQRRK